MVVVCYYSTILLALRADTFNNHLVIGKLKIIRREGRNRKIP